MIHAPLSYVLAGDDNADYGHRRRSAVPGAELEHLTPERGLDVAAVTRDTVAFLSALEGQRDARFVLQTACHPSVEAPERGRIDIALIAVVGGGNAWPASRTLPVLDGLRPDGRRWQDLGPHQRGGR